MQGVPLGPKRGLGPPHVHPGTPGLIKNMTILGQFSALHQVRHLGGGRRPAGRSGEPWGTCRESPRDPNRVRDHLTDTLGRGTSTKIRPVWDSFLHCTRSDTLAGVRGPPGGPGNLGALAGSHPGTQTGSGTTSRTPWDVGHAQKYYHFGTVFCTAPCPTPWRGSEARR